MIYYRPKLESCGAAWQLAYTVVLRDTVDVWVGKGCDSKQQHGLSVWMCVHSHSILYFRMTASYLLLLVPIVCVGRYAVDQERQGFVPPLIHR
jgi:hypothetical protein